MSTITIKPQRLSGEIIPPADKSISHRALIIAALASGKTEITNLSLCDDCLRSQAALVALGTTITKNKGRFCVQGNGLNGLRKPETELYLGNSGTSMRLILGVLAGQDFSCLLSGDASLSHRPMGRVIQPLSLMGAKISGRNAGEFAPLTIQGGALKPIKYQMPVASAQVKSAILLAGLYADGQTVVQEPAKSRDHTERMLRRFGANVSVNGLSVSVKGKAQLTGSNLDIPADISSASFFLIAACICKGSEVLTKSVGLNPTRTGLLHILQKMGASISWTYQDAAMANTNYTDEPRGDITAQFSHLKPITVGPEQIPFLIDELPVLMVAATQADGQTVIKGAGELRVKETDRIQAMVTNLSKMGAQIENCQDDIIIQGPVKLKGCSVDSFSDHRIAMSMTIAGLIAQGPSAITNAECVDISFPGFYRQIQRLAS